MGMLTADSTALPMVAQLAHQTESQKDNLMDSPKVARTAQKRVG